MKTLYLFTLFLSLNSWALKPIDGVILGKVPIEDQKDPLSEYFVQDKNLYDEMNSLKLAYETFDGKELKHYCESTKKTKFSEIGKEKIAKRSIVASAQYIVLDKLIKKIASTAKTIGMETKDFSILADNLVKNYCSQNITVYGHRIMKNNLISEFATTFKIDLFEKIPSHLRREMTKEDFFRKSLANQVELFRSFCSWGGDIDKLTFLNNYLQDPIVMNMLFNTIEGKRIFWNTRDQKYEKGVTTGVGVLCESLMCRHTDFQTFNKRLPFVLGAFDLRSNLKSIYCHYLKEAPSGVTHLKGNTKNWHKKAPLFHDVNLKSELIGLMTETPNYFNLFDEKHGLDELMVAKYKSALDQWSDKRLHKLSRELFFEESLEISSQTKVIPGWADRKKYQIDLVLGLGEFDHHLRSIDKLSATFDMNFPESFLAWVQDGVAKIDISKKTYESERFLHQVESKVKVYLENKSKHFIISPIANNLEKVIAGDLISWTQETPKDRLKRTSNKSIAIKVNLHYGLFALKYFHDRFSSEYREN